MSTLRYSTISERELMNYKRRIRRQREIRRKVSLTVLTFVIALLVTLSCRTIISQASSETTEVTYKYYTSYEVECGDTLWGLAKDYIDYSHYDNIQEYIDEVVAINHLSSDSIKAGQCIVIPYFSSIYR